MKNLKIVTNNDLKNWAKEIFEKNSFKMIDVSEKKETFRRALASGKIYVGKEVFELIKSKKMPKGDPITLAEVSAVLGVKKTSELIPLCHPLPIDHTATKIIMNEEDSSLGDFIEDKNALIPIDAAVKSSLRDTTTRILSSLTPREERVLRMRFGIGMNSDHTLEEVGQQFSVTRERIRQIEAKALRKLKHPSRSKQLKSFLES